LCERPEKPMAKDIKDRHYLEPNSQLIRRQCRMFSGLRLSGVGRLHHGLSNPGTSTKSIHKRIVISALLLGAHSSEEKEKNARVEPPTGGCSGVKLGLSNPCDSPRTWLIIII
jgi:hypothetical protein